MCGCGDKSESFQALLARFAASRGKNKKSTKKHRSVSKCTLAGTVQCSAGVISKKTGRPKHCSNRIPVGRSFCKRHATKRLTYDGLLNKLAKKASNALKRKRSVKKH